MKTTHHGMATALALLIRLFLKAADIVDWSFWIILSPIWLTFLTSLIEALHGEYLEYKKNNRR